MLHKLKFAVLKFLQHHKGFMGTSLFADAQSKQSRSALDRKKCVSFIY